MKEIAAGIATAVRWSVLILVMALLAACVIVPRLLGAVPLTVLTSSMEPIHSPGDLVVSRPVPIDDIAIGDVVTMQPVSGDPTLVTHRVIAKTFSSDGEVTLTTRGDANGADDDPIVADQVMGKVIYAVPLIGHVTYALEPAHRTALATGAGIALLAVGAGLVLHGGIRSDRRSLPGWHDGDGRPGGRTQSTTDELRDRRTLWTSRSPRATSPGNRWTRS